jgi:hypothetical protein
LLIFEKLQESAKVGRLNSYFLPFLDIFSFANTHIRLIPEGDLEETLKNQCERIQLFCEVILGTPSRSCSTICTHRITLVKIPMEY